MIKAITLGELAAHVGGRVIGDPAVAIRKMAGIDEASEGDITFLSNPRYHKYLAHCRASAVILAPGSAPEPPVGPRNYLETTDPYVAYAKILKLFSHPVTFDGTISPKAFIDRSAVVSEGVTIFPNAYVGARARIGKSSILFPGVYVGDDVHVGVNCVLYANVVIREGCRIGDRVILHAGSVIGSDGFGYAGFGSERIKIPQIGIVEIGDDVEIGANSTIDRATLGKTTIGRGVKIDNLVQVGHNVTVGENSLLAAQVGIAGSTRVGKDVTLAGQVGVVNHLEIGDGAVIGPQSGVGRSVPNGAVVSSGLHAAPHQEWLKVMILLPKLPELWALTRRLERKIANLLRRSERGVGE